MDDFLFVLIQKMKKRINTLTTLVNSIKESKSVRFVVGTSTAGWTSADCDYLCDGTNDQIEINAAITALPSGGGEIIILDGTYNITANINVNKNNVSIKGNGTSTILKRMWNSASQEGVIKLNAVSYCNVCNLLIDGNLSVYTNNYNVAIQLITCNNCSVISTVCSNNKSFPIYLTDCSYSVISKNICNNNGERMRIENSQNDLIIENICSNSAKDGMMIVGSINCIIANNMCKNNDNNNCGIFLLETNGCSVLGNICVNNGVGIELSGSDDNSITCNTCKDNINGIMVIYSDRNSIVSNVAMRGTGLSSDYTSVQNTIFFNLSGSDYNLVSSNIIMGKNYVVDGGTGNTFVNNKYN